jgi:hypothetical protein
MAKRRSISIRQRHHSHQILRKSLFDFNLFNAVAVSTIYFNITMNFMCVAEIESVSIIVY